jgi:hypothetical protein
VSAPVHAPSRTPLLLPLILSHNNHPPRVQRSVYYQRKRDLFTLNKASAHSDVITVRCNFARLTFHGGKRNKAAQDFGRVRTPKERVKRAGLRHAPAENCGAASREHGASQTDWHWRRRREQWPAAAISSTEVAGGGKEKKPTPKKCPHGRRKTRCIECGGASICEHKRQRGRCRECGGASICEHKRQRNTCRECGGTSVC